MKVRKTAAMQSQNLKNIERMRLEVNKRIEVNLVEIIAILDDMYRQAAEDGKTLDGEIEIIISTETILRASSVASEDIDETIKARFLARLVKEYRRNRERAKQQQLREQMEREIELNIFKRFPSLSASPDRGQSGGRSGSRGESGIKSRLYASKGLKKPVTNN